MILTDADRIRVTEAVTRAELGTDGEIVTIVAPRSDAYHDVSAQWGVLAMLLMLTCLAVWPGIAERIHALVAGDWAEPSARALFTVALVLMAATFLLARLVLASMPLRLLLTPGRTKARRVRRRATLLFHAAVEARTRAATGVLLYLSLEERRAEIVADAAIHGRVAPEIWGEAMAALVEAVRDGRPGDGMAAAVERIGSVLAAHFPRSADDTNELPDRLILL